jgi:hypothetical protein
MPSSKMWHRMALARIEVSEECRTSVIMVTRIGELGTLVLRNVGSYKSHTA